MSASDREDCLSQPNMRMDASENLTTISEYTELKTRQMLYHQRRKPSGMIHKQIEEVQLLLSYDDEPVKGERYKTHVCWSGCTWWYE